MKYYYLTNAIVPYWTRNDVVADTLQAIIEEQNLLLKKGELVDISAYGLVQKPLHTGHNNSKQGFWMIHLLLLGLIGCVFFNNTWDMALFLLMAVLGILFLDNVFLRDCSKYSKS